MSAQVADLLDGARRSDDDAVSTSAMRWTPPEAAPPGPMYRAVKQLADRANPRIEARG